MSQVFPMGQYSGLIAGIRSRMSIKLALTVFAAIVLVEAAILVPSALKYEADLKEFMLKIAESAIVPLGPLEGESLGSGAEALVGANHILGLAIVEGTEVVARLGDAPVPGRDGAGERECVAAEGFCDVLFKNGAADRKIVLRVDLNWISEEVIAFIWRIIGLVTLISGFVTLVTMMVVSSRVISPLLQMQSLLAKARENPESTELLTLPRRMDDELGDAIALMNETLAELAESRRNKINSIDQRFKDFAQAASDFFWEMDSELRFSYFSERFEQVSGVAPADLLGKTREETGIPNVDSGQWKRHLEALHNHQAFQDFVHGRTRPDGSVVWLSISGQPIYDEMGVFAGYRGVGQDIYERIESERQLVAAKDAAIRAQQVAEEASAAKLEFLSSMSHELRTPLNSVIGYAQILESDPDLQLSADNRAALEQILRSGRFLLELIQEVLDLNRIEMGNMLMSIDDIDPVPIVQDCLQVAASMANRKGLRLEASIQEDEVSLISADATRVKQVLLNLLSNAVKYNSTGQSISFRCEEQQEGYLRFLVMDDGPGIPKARQADIFKPFDRLGMEAQEIEGTGIGLTISQKLVQLMGGTLSFRSVEGEGSAFWFGLPMAEPAEEAETIASSGDKISGAAGQDARVDTSSESDQRTVLYIEDNPANQGVMRMIFNRMPTVELLFAHSAEIGLEVAAHQPIDLILMDINLPGMSGIEAVAQLKANSSLSHIPVVAVSAATMPSDLEKARDAGFVQYLTKPINVNEVTDLVYSILYEVHYP